MNEKDENTAIKKEKPAQNHPKKPKENKPLKDPNITKIADLQQMNIDQLAIYAKNIGQSVCSKRKLYYWRCNNRRGIQCVAFRCNKG